MGKYRNVDAELTRLSTEHKTGKEISKILNLNYVTVHKKLRKLGINLYNFHNELKFDNTVFDNIDTEEKSYWLGFLFADGYISNNRNAVELSLKGSDYDHLIKYSKFLKHRSENIVKLGKATCKGLSYERCRCCVTDKHFHDRLIELGCIPNKSLTLKFPNVNIFKNKILVHDFIRGYVDGDGCLTHINSNYRLSISIIGTKEFLQGIINIYPEVFNGMFRKDKRCPESNTYIIDCACAKADYFSTILYENAKVYLDRKYERFAVLHRNV